VAENEPSQENPTPPKRKGLPWYWRMLRIILLAYVGLLVLLYFAQKRFIFPGAAMTQGQPYSRIASVPDGELLTLTTSNGDKVAALFGQAMTPEHKIRPDAPQRPTMIFFYGNAMCLKSALQLFDQFRALGVNVLIPEYAGYGMSDGDVSEAGLYATADAAYDYLLTRSDIDAKKIVASGWSLGSAVAIDLAARKPVAGLATFSAFSRMAEMGHNTFPIIPTFMVSLILKHRFENARKIADVKCPILIGHSRADSLIPYRMSDALVEAAQSPVERLTIEGADHSDFFAVGGAAVMGAIGGFIEQVAGK
jgi:hypothetical protein